jgi:transcription antitermination protein NusB
MKPRRLARIAALQTLYEVDISHHDWQSAFAGRMSEEPLPKDAEAFARELVEAVTVFRAALDELIGRIAPEWPPDQIAIIDRNILRIGIYEVLYSTSTPLKVAINESVELAKLFGSDNSTRFINGALGTLAEDRNTYLQSMNRHK